MDLTLPIFTEPNAAREHLEKLVWPSGEPRCPHCGVIGKATLLGGKQRAGLHKCNACRRPFSVTVGTIMERSHLPLNKWVLGFHLMASFENGVSAQQLQRVLGIQYKTAWFVAHRLRAAMKSVEQADPVDGGVE
jgi:transposase-like protein